MAHRKAPALRLLFLGTILAGLAACDESLDFDLRGTTGQGLDTSGAVRQVTTPRPMPDDRGVISYPNYQVVVANRGDTIADVAARIGVDAVELGRYNGIAPDTPLRQDEIIALPGRVAEPSPDTGSLTTGPILPSGQIDVETLASGAIERAPSTTRRPSASAQTGVEPVRHRVERGETAYSIARLYNVSVRSLADWNGLGSDLSVREGQFLLIPVTTETGSSRSGSTTAPGQGTPTPLPPSSATPLPENDTMTAAEAQNSAPQSPNLGDQRTDASGTPRLMLPVDGNIIRPFSSGRNGGIDIAASAGSAVKAADNGTVAAITQNTEEIPVLVIRHADNLLTVYANIGNITVEKGDTVSRGQRIASVRNSNPAFVRFEVRRGFDSVDPMPFLN